MMHVTTDRGLDLGCKVSRMEPLLMSPEAESPASPAGVSATAPHSRLVSVLTPPAAVCLPSGASQQLRLCTVSVLHTESTPRCWQPPPPSGLTRPPQSLYLPACSSNTPHALLPECPPPNCSLCLERSCILASSKDSAQQLP